MTSIRKSLALSGFLKKIRFAKKDILGVVGEKKFSLSIGRLLEKRDYSAQSLFSLVKESFEPLGDLKRLDLEMIYDYLIMKVDEDARERKFTKDELDFMAIFINIYEVMLRN